MSKIKIFGRGSQVKIAVRRRRPRVIRTEDVIDFLRYTSPAEFCYVIYIALKAKKTVRIVEVEQEKARRTRIREQLGGGACMMRIFVDDSFEDCNEENRFFLQYDDPELYYGDSEEDGTEVEDFYTEEDYDDKPF